jgi:glycopeptide antibiotics resistance protein
VPDLPNSGIRFLDKFIHFILYGMHCYFCILGLVKQYRFSSYRKRIPFYCFLFSSGLGIVLEVFQSLTGLRNGDVIDAIANSLGALTFYLFFKLFLERGIKSNI